MYKRKAGQISMLESPAMFGTIPLNAKNEWVKLGQIIPWVEFEKRYDEQFKSRTGQPACPARMALGALLIKERYRCSDDDVVAELEMNPYLQYFIGLYEFQYKAPFDASMLTRFRQRITPEMLAWVNDVVIGRRKRGEDQDKNDHRDGGGEAQQRPDKEESAEAASSVQEEPGETTGNEGTLILDATCAPQYIRFPTDVSLLNEARENLEKFIDLLHEKGYTDGQKPRTYRKTARKAYVRFSKTRKKTQKVIRKALRKQLGYVARDIRHIMKIKGNHAGALGKALSDRQMERLAAIMLLYDQQRTMYESGQHSVPNRIVSLAQPWVRPIVRGKQNAEVEFGAKVEMSLVDGYLRIERLSWDAFNEGTTLIDSVEAYRRDYGHYPKRILADKIFRTRGNLEYCKSHKIRLSGPKLGRPPKDEALLRQQIREEWLESGERAEIERRFGLGKTRYTLDCVMTKLKETSEVSIHISVLAMNLWKKLRLLLRFIFCRIFGYRWIPCHLDSGCDTRPLCA